MKRAPRSLQHHVLYRKYNGQDSEISALLGKCGIKSDEFGGVLELFKDFYWKNPETDAFIVANFRITIEYENVPCGASNAPIYYDIVCDAAVIGGRYELRAEWPDAPRNIQGLRGACRNFFKFMEKARNHPDINAPFGRSDELPFVHNVGPKDVFRIVYIDRQLGRTEDRFCELKRSVYSMPATKDIKWIDAYSEARKMRLDINLSTVVLIEKEIEEKGAIGMRLSYQTIHLTNGSWPRI